MRDMDKLYDDLIEMHIMAMYDFVNPIDYHEGITAFDINSRKDKAIERYRSDSLFHQRVRHLASSTIAIIDRHPDCDKDMVVNDR